MTDEHTIEDLKAQASKLQSSLENSKEILKPIEDEEVKFNSELYQVQQAYKEQMEILQKRKNEIAKKKYEASVALNAEKQTLASIQLQIKHLEDEALKKKMAEEAAAKEAAERKALSHEFDKATSGALWREWAKDHQISAGHKITRDRYVILADPMGLGKTLSSIITADMSEKLTKTAHPDFPILGEEKEVYVPLHYAWTEKAEQAFLNAEWPFTLSKFAHVTSVVAGEKTTGYLDYDLKNKLLDEGYTTKVEPHYETQVVNAITRPVGRKVLYFCPAPLLRNVLEEWRRWAPHRNATYVGNMSKAERNFVFDTLGDLQEYVIIVNYEAWRRDKALLDRLAHCRFDTVIIDEAHNIKDMTTSAYKGVEQVIFETKPEYIIPMTGTPILNRPQELFPMLHLINPTEFNNERDFLWNYCEEYYIEGSNSPKWKFKAGGLDLLTKKIHKNLLRRTKEQAGIVLPEKTIIYHELDRDDETYAEQAKARQHMKDYATIVIDEKAGKALQATVMIALITRLRQIETWPAGIIQYDTYTDPITGSVKKRIDPHTGQPIIKLQLDVEESQKLDYIIRWDKESEEWEGLIPDSVEDERMVVFSQFKAPLQELKRRVEASGRKAVILDGSTPTNLREEIRLDFDRKHTPNREKAKWDVLLANYKAGGVGLNLTCATNMIICDSEWNPGKRDQAFDRIHRIGQTENVTIQVVLIKDTIDKWLEDLMQAKDSVVSGFDNAVQSITANDLKNALDSGLI